MGIKQGRPGIILPCRSMQLHGSSCVLEAAANVDGPKHEPT